MAVAKTWDRQQLLVAFSLYVRLPFGRLHARNSDIIQYAVLMGRTPSSLAMKLNNIASLDPVITSTGRVGLKGASNADRAIWLEMQTDWLAFSEQVNAAVSLLADPIQAEWLSFDSLESLPVVHATAPVFANHPDVSTLLCA